MCNIKKFWRRGRIILIKWGKRDTDKDLRCPKN
jgi:hypothetical protein